MCASPGHWCRTIGLMVQCKPYRGGVRARLDHINESYELWVIMNNVLNLYIQHDLCIKIISQLSLKLCKS
jgi:hypothetical protein